MNNETRSRLLRITALANDYCNAMQQTFEMEKDEFLQTMTDLLPRLYWEFADFAPQNDTTLGKVNSQKGNDGEGNSDEDGFNDDPNPDPDELLDLEETEERYYGEYVDEDFYESVRRHAEALLGPEDTFLETFEEDMKYSETPIAASISEGLADIFQPLFNFISVVRDSEGEELEGAYLVCRENFTGYWAQTLCNVMRPLNHLRFGR